MGRVDGTHGTNPPPHEETSLHGTFSPRDRRHGRGHHWWVCEAPSWVGTKPRSSQSRTPSRTTQARLFSRRRLSPRFIFWSVPTPSLRRCALPVTAYTGIAEKRC